MPSAIFMTASIEQVLLFKQTLSWPLNDNSKKAIIGLVEVK